MSSPGRSCPIAYATRADGLAAAAGVRAETVYIIGGLYGNRYALEQVLALAEREVAAGLPRPVLVFNGDFNWFNADAATFAAINTEVLKHYAIQGNVEAELANPSTDAGCGCAYPEWVDAGVVQRSNQIMARLQSVAGKQPELIEQLRRLPRQLSVDVDGLRVGVIHGDPDSLAGWGLALENMPPPGSTPRAIAQWFEAANAQILACSHTCLPYLQDFKLDQQPRLVINNGAAGMPNFAGSAVGLISRISSIAAPFARIYGTRIAHAHCDALALPCADAAWKQWFERLWPAGSPAWQSYRSRIEHGPQHRIEDAIRLSQRHAHSA